MPASHVETMWGAITMIEAQQELTKLKAQDWSHMSPDDRSAYHGGLYKQAYPDIYKKETQITFEDLQKLLGS
jgi:hypothetical protein